MKSVRRVGCCVLVPLCLGFSVVMARAEEARQDPATAKGAANSPPMCRCAGDRSPSAARIRQVLSEPLKPSGLDFTDESLNNIVNFLQEEYDIPIQIDARALDDAGLTPDEPVTVRLRNISLRSFMRLMLKTNQLTYVIRDEVLMITTPEEAESELIACVYDVRDLVGRNRDNREIKLLADAIVSCVAPYTWAVRKDGEAEIKILQRGLLIISQTQAVHEEIAELLAMIRETLRQPLRQPAGEATGGGGGYGFGGGFGFGSGGGNGDLFGDRVNEDEKEPQPAPAEADPFQ